MTEQQLEKIVERELRDWSAYVLLVLARKMTAAKLVLTGDLLRSLHAQFIQGSAGLATARLIFEDAGRIRDMRRLNYSKQTPIDVIEAYVKQIGLSKFKYVPGYKKGTFPLTQSIAINRIAWGIAVSRTQENRIRRKPWFNKTFYSQIDTLIDDLSAAYSQAASEAITDNLNNG